MRRLPMVSMLSLALLLCGAGCGDNATNDIDASTSGDGGAIADATPGTDGQTPLNWVDFTITGCDETDADAGVMTACEGAAALSLSFTAIAPAAIEVYRWRFGDGAESMQASPTHVYAAPGVYDVSLVVGGPGGTATQLKEAIVIARGASLGAPCNLDGQCGQTLDCVCDDAAQCGAALPHGLCAASCSAVEPCASGVCADLAPSGPANPADWQRAMCLEACADDSECPAGLACRDVRRGDGPGWTTGCFSPALLGDIGASCTDGLGQFDDARCTGGTCAPIGARGACTDACTAQSCPPGSACATFTGAGLGSMCVASCDASACDSDPWLACTAPGGPGAKGFSVDETAAAAGYCAPKRCTGAAECGPDGACVSGYCAAM